MFCDLAAAYRFDFLSDSRENDNCKNAEHCACVCKIFNDLFFEFVFKVEDCTNEAKANDGEVHQNNVSDSPGNFVERA